MSNHEFLRLARESLPAVRRRTEMNEVEVPEVQTCHGQTIRPGTQVAYTTPLEPKLSAVCRGIFVSGGDLKVGTVYRIVQTGIAFAEADATFQVYIKDGDIFDIIDIEDVCVTDDKFQYGGVRA